MSYLRLGVNEEEEAQRQEEEAAEALLGPAYATDSEFWKLLFATIFFGGAMGAIAYLFLDSIEKVQDQWLGEDYGKSLDTVDFFKGQWYWLAITCTGGLVLGVTKLLIGFPSDVSGFFQEVKEQYVEKGHGMKLLLSSWISLAAGASVGPEAALGSLGGGLGRLWGDYFQLSRESTELYVVYGMAAALGALFPNSIIAVVCMLEVGKVETMHSSYMRSVSLLTVASSSALAMYLLCRSETYFPFNPIAVTYEFRTMDLLKAVAFGIVSGLIGAIHILISALVKRAFAFLSGKIANLKLRSILIPVIGGLLLGILYVALPLTIGSGSRQIHQMILGNFGYKLLFASAFAKSVTFAISVGSGFVGGNLFPFLFIGAAVGLGFHDLINDRDELPMLLSLGCFMGGVPSSVAPTPLTIILLISFSLQLGRYQAAPILISCVVAHLTTCGLGILLKIARRARRS